MIKKQLARRLRSHVKRELYDESSALDIGIAIYSLADSRDLRSSKYIGQTSLPRRRFFQHLNTAKLWLPDENRWWVPQPTLRPLYRWMRELYWDEERLPTMIVHEWAVTPDRARTAERARIYESLVRQLPILNVEREFLGDQWHPRDA